MYHNFLEEVEVHNLKGKEKRKQAIELIESFRDFLTLKEILKTIGVSPSSYYRWRVEAYGCETNKYKRCNFNRANQLTAKEVETLIKYATLPQFRKFSTVSLMHYCKRHRILHCSLDSWYKYLKLHGIVRRTTPNRRKKQYKNGLRAKKVNEYWHIDLTELKYGEKDKAYLQIVIDNYSRLIVAWKLSNRKTMDLTYKTIIKSFHFAPSFQGVFVMDAGSENTGSKPKWLLHGKGIKSLIAKKDIRFSNSMVEAVFRQFKQRFYLKESKNFRSLYSQVYKFVKQYNRIIPHTSLKGGLPIEVFKGTFDHESYTRDNREHFKSLVAKRKAEHRGCIKCKRSFLLNERVYN